MEKEGESLFLLSERRRRVPTHEEGFGHLLGRWMRRGELFSWKRKRSLGRRKKPSSSSLYPPARNSPSNHRPPQKKI